MVLRIKTASENAEIDYSLQKLLEQPNGLERLATETLPPYIRETRDYESFARKVMFVHQITEADTHPVKGEPHVYYPKDLRSHAAFYADDGEITQLLIEGDGVDVGIFTVASDDTTINLKRLMTQKYNYVERVRELSGQAMGMAEDFKLMQLVNALIDANEATQHVASDETTLVKDDLVDLTGTVAQHDLPVEAYVMNPLRQNDILKWGQDELDELSRREIIETGVRYTIWGKKIITSRAVPTNTIYAFADKEFVGRMPVLKDVTTKLTETANKLEKGLFLLEFIGMYVASHKAVGRLVINAAANNLALGNSQISVKM